MKSTFDWDERKNLENQIKHGISFEEAQHAFLDPSRLIIVDDTHSVVEERHYCIGRIERGIVTVRFTYREGQIRIYGAGLWRKGRQLYAEAQQNK